MNKEQILKELSDWIDDCHQKPSLHKEFKVACVAECAEGGALLAISKTYQTILGSAETHLFREYRNGSNKR